MPKARQVKTAEGEEASKGSLEAAFELLEALPVPVFVKSRDGRYISVNRAWEELFGIPRGRFLGKRVKDLYPQSPAVAERHGAMDEALWAKPGGQSYEIPITTPAGRVRDTVYYKATFPPGGEPEGLIGAIFDITGRKLAEAALRESEERFRRTFELAGSGIAHIGLDRRFVRVNARLCEILGYSEKELLGLTGREISHPDDLDVINAQRPRLYAGEIDSVRLEKRYLRKDRSVVWVAFTMVVERDAAGKPQYEIAIFDDITHRKQAEMALREQTERLQIGQKAAQMIILDRDIPDDRLTWSDSPEWLRGPLPPSGQYPLFKDQIHPEDREKFLAARAIAIESLQGQTQEFRIVRTDGQVVWLLTRQKVFADASGKANRMLVALFDITERKVAERALGESEARFRSLTALSSDWYWEQDAEFGLTFMSGRMGERTGLDPSAYLGRKRWDRPALNLSEADWARHRAQLERHEPFRDFELQRPAPEGGSRWISLSGEPVFDDEGRFTGYRGVGSDITEAKLAEAELRRAHGELAQKAQELERSNSELEQFAYVASHDLQEPLRMMSSYTQLLMRRYGDKFDKDAREFMHYVVDGAARMKQLIEDLLAYSRVGTRAKNFGSADVEAALRRAITNLRAAIEEAGAAVTWDPLPTVRADDAQLTQLFQNLIGNALKFRSASVPRIHVSASQLEDEWQLTVRDNGIGIERQYFERIFMVFQRLHNKAEYPGTGIGLAICKKVVERHGGRIWVESQPGEGSAFHFTLPKDRGNAHD